MDKLTCVIELEKTRGFTYLLITPELSIGDDTLKIDLTDYDERKIRELLKNPLYQDRDINGKLVGGQ